MAADASRKIEPNQGVPSVARPSEAAGMEARAHQIRSHGRNHQQTMGYARSALKIIESLRHPADPPSFEVWYAYAAGSNPALNLTIDGMLQRKVAMSEADLNSVYTQYLSPTVVTEQIDTVRCKIGDEVDHVVTMIDSAIGAADSYKANLADAGQELANAKDAESLRVIVKSLVHATREAEQQNRDLQSRLQGSKHEIAELQANLETIRAEGLTDSLTKLANRKHFDDALERAIAQSKQSGKSLSLLICDVDHFKRFNDTFGHVMGDQVLRLLGTAMRQSVRGQDIPARYGGEEFAIILPNTSLQQATAVAENIRNSVSAKELVNRATGARLGKLSISVGVAEFRADDRSKSLIERADQCLYSAKQHGRNRVVSESTAEVANAKA